MLRLVIALALVLLAGAGCGSGEIEAPSYAPGLFPKVAYSGFNANARFRVLFATSAPSPRWTVSDGAVATIVPSPPPANVSAGAKDLSFALLTTTRAGETTVTATSGGTSVTARVVVKGYTDEQLTVGRARYETASTDPTRPACASCHATAGGVDHSALKMAGFEDATILGVIQDATYPPSPSGQSTTSDYAPKGPLKFTGHKWSLTDPERDGILSHLRSLPLGGL